MAPIASASRTQVRHLTVRSVCWCAILAAILGLAATALSGASL